jgi:uncharacterized DUF497 family protein
MNPLGSEALEFNWDNANRDHLALHNVSPEEAQQAILDPHAVLLEIQSGDGEERTKALGITSGGRILAVVFTFRGEAIRPSWDRLGLLQFLEENGPGWNLEEHPELNEGAAQWVESLRREDEGIDTETSGR